MVNQMWTASDVLSKITAVDMTFLRMAVHVIRTERHCNTELYDIMGMEEWL